MPAWRPLPKPESAASRRRDLTRRLRLILPLLLALLVTGCDRVDPEQARLCDRLIAAFEVPPAAVEILGHEIDPAAPNAVVLRYRATRPSEAAAEHRIICRFAGRDFERGRLDLIGVDTDRQGSLSGPRLFFLRRWLGMFDAQAAASGDQGARGTTPFGQALYALQQLLNATTSGCVYGLLAIGYTLVYGILGRINLAFGEIAMAGAFVTYLGVTLAAASGVMPALALVAVLAAAAATGATHGWAAGRLVFRPLRRAGTQAALIASLGLAILLQEGVRLVQGPQDRWLQPMFTRPIRLAATADGFVLSAIPAQILIVGLTAALYAALGLIVTRTRYGRCHRACADDSVMAALLGVDVDRIVALTFALGAAYAAAAGFVIMLHYGGVNFFLGHLIGFKALTAAVVGGIGSVPGAMLGGLLVAVVETIWTGYFTIAYKDIAAFVLLALALIARPHGLLGRASARGD